MDCSHDNLNQYHAGGHRKAHCQDCLAHGLASRMLAERRQRLARKFAYAALLAELSGTRSRLYHRSFAVGEIPLQVRKRVNSISKQMLKLEQSLRNAA